MIKTVRKIYAVWNYDEEETWLNEMASKGYNLISVGFCKYVFDECQPNEYVIRIEYLNKNLFNINSDKYLNLMEETGAKYLGNVMSWAYFSKKSESTNFELYSDNSSKISYIEKVLILIKTVFYVKIFLGIINIVFSIISPFSINIFIGLINLFIAIISIKGYQKINSKKKSLQQINVLFE